MRSPISPFAIHLRRTELVQPEFWFARLPKEFFRTFNRAFYPDALLQCWYLDRMETSENSQGHGAILSITGSQEKTHSQVFSGLRRSPGQRCPSFGPAFGCATARNTLDKATMRSKKSYVAFETLISVAINTTLSAGFVYLVFHRQTLIESHYCRMERKA
jgi:hypothetical protein